MPKGKEMLDPSVLDDIAKKLSDILPSNLKDSQEELQKQFRRLLESALRELELVSREEFDTQRKVLARTREKLDALEQRLTEISPAKERG